MSARSFIDTNVLVYAFDDAAPAKRDRARALLTDPDGPLIISFQVIGEFYVVVTRKLATPLDEAQAGAAVADCCGFRLCPSTAT